MTGLKALIAGVLCAGVLVCGAFAEVPEPDGYRMDDYDAPVPEGITGGVTIDDDAAYALWRSGRVPFIDVMPNPPRPKGLPEDVIWRGRARYSTPGAIWLPNAGFGRLTPPMEAEFREGLAIATGGEPDAPVVFLCRADCWMSWNAAKRALEWGFTNVFWYRDGSTGWTFWEWPVERLKPAIPLKDG